MIDGQRKVGLLMLSFEAESLLDSVKKALDYFFFFLFLLLVSN